MNSVQVMNTLFANFLLCVTCTLCINQHLITVIGGCHPVVFSVRHEMCCRVILARVTFDKLQAINERV